MSQNNQSRREILKTVTASGALMTAGVASGKTKKSTSHQQSNGHSKRDDVLVVNNTSEKQVITVELEAELTNGKTKSVSRAVPVKASTKRDSDESPPTKALSLPFFSLQPQKSVARGVKVGYHTLKAEFEGNTGETKLLVEEDGIPPSYTASIYLNSAGAIEAHWSIA